VIDHFPTTASFDGSLHIHLLFSGCASMKSVQTAAFPGHREKGDRAKQVSGCKREDVIGRLAIIRLETGDTLPDIARHFSLGLNAISTANPGWMYGFLRPESVSCCL